LVPLAEAAVERARPLAIDAKDRLVPLAEAAVVKARPLAIDAKDRLVPLAEVVMDKARPVVGQAREKVGEVIEADVIPRLTDLRDQIEPLAGRSVLAVAALKGEDLVPAAPVQKKRRHPVLKMLGLAILGAVIGLIIKTLLETRDDGWELQDEADAELEPVVEFVEPAPEQQEAPVDYGDGSYRGDNPPEGFTIKGNERSMKFHVPTALGFERTVTDLWFNSPEAAEQAGFTRALR
ncbi:MAG: hypothetical protein FWD63_05695, partial [Propionibacteriaceae bacterium]|nr:hypothetical protein [Propionibacteriaceae bacterium]